MPKYRHSVWYVAVCGGMCWYVVVCGMVCGCMWWYLVVCGGMWRYVAVCAGMWWYVVKSVTRLYLYFKKNHIFLFFFHKVKDKKG